MFCVSSVNVYAGSLLWNLAGNKSVQLYGEGEAELINVAEFSVVRSI